MARRGAGVARGSHPPIAGRASGWPPRSQGGPLARLSGRLVAALVPGWGDHRIRVPADRLGHAAGPRSAVCGLGGQAEVAEDRAPLVARLIGGHPRFADVGRGRVASQFEVALERDPGRQDFGYCGILSSVDLRYSWETRVHSVGLIMSDLINDIALEIFRADQKLSFGRTKGGADENWRSLGPEGRRKWRALSKVAIEAIENLRDRPTVATMATPRTSPRSGLSTWR